MSHLNHSADVGAAAVAKCVEAAASNGEALVLQVLMLRC